ncbi:MAG: cryptochrome/photolyase family protein [Granulosicoccus sp.]
MTTIAFVFPHQLFKDHPVLRESVQKVLLIEHSLFFGDKQYPLRFHKQKLAYHRATMHAYAAYLEKQQCDVQIVPYAPTYCCLDDLCKQAKSEGNDNIVFAELNDFTLRTRLISAATTAGLTWHELGTPGFINTREENHEWRRGRKRWFMADFYQWQRKRLDILMDGQLPMGGQWSFDEDNRKKLPKAEVELLPKLPTVNKTASIRHAMATVEKEFPAALGSLDNWYYPTTHASAEKWLDTFFKERFAKFGPFEDAMAAGHNWLHHSVLTPMLNTGLLTPLQVIDKAMSFAETSAVPMNSLEGFIRQILGWREFMRATYDDLSVPMRTTNHWNHTRKLPQAFYDGTTGIDPVDDVILRVLDSGYCHHIERLMIIGGFLFLCEVDPDEIYNWFMEMFIDSYDWVMVPNVYAMSQHADGGAITTKPYFSGSNYVLKMSNYKKGEWSEIWDALFWRWIFLNSGELKGNPRWAMMVRNGEKMSADKRRHHLKVAKTYLKGLH